MKKYKYKIKTPYVSKGKIIETDENNKYRFPYGGILIDPDNYPDMFELVKEPLFVTDDGVEIFEGDKYVIVYKSTFNIDSYYNKDYKQCFVFIASSQTIITNPNIYRFSTKEAAEKWIDENKPKYNKLQIIEAINSIFMHESVRDELFKYFGIEEDN